MSHTGPFVASGWLCVKLVVAASHSGKLPLSSFTLFSCSQRQALIAHSVRLDGSFLTLTSFLRHRAGETTSNELANAPKPPMITAVANAKLVDAVSVAM